VNKAVDRAAGALRGATGSVLSRARAFHVKPHGESLTVRSAGDESRRAQERPNRPSDASRSRCPQPIIRKSLRRSFSRAQTPLMRAASAHPALAEEPV
jgi:hypothetical protein